MELLLFAAYLILFSWLVTRTPFFTRSGLSTPQLIIVFLLKVMAGIFYAWIGVYYGEMAQMVDTWAYHYESLRETAILKSVPSQFFGSIFQNTYGDGYTKFFAHENSWWNDLKGTFFVKTLALFNLLSFGNYYINLIFYSFISLFGPVAIYRVMIDVFPDRRLPILIATFFIPSFIYWTSGIHKDGIVFLGIAAVIYQVYFGLKQNRFGAGRIALILFGLSLVLALRNFLVIPFIPAILAWIVAHYNRRKQAAIFAVIYVVFVLLFFTAGSLHPKLNLPEEVVSRQEAFLKLGGGSAVAVNKLKPTFGSFAANLPQSFALSIVRPYPSDVRHLLSLAASLEINFLLLLFAAFLLVKRSGPKLSPALLFFLAFSFSVLLMIGYTVNVLGAIVRYRSVVLTLLIVPMVAQIDWRRIAGWVSGSIPKNQNV